MTGIRSCCRCLAPFVPSYLRNNIAVVAWLRTGTYVSHDTQKQRIVANFRTIEDSVARYCRTRD